MAGSEYIDPKAYRPKDFAKAHGVSRSWVYDQMKDGLLAYVDLGSFRLIPASESERLLEGAVAK